MTSPMPETTRRFLAALPAEQRQALEHLRRVIIAAAPNAEEYIGYGIPRFGRMERWYRSAPPRRIAPSMYRALR